MKSKDIQNAALRLHGEGLSAGQISTRRAGAVSKPTVNRWIKMVKVSGAIEFKKIPGRNRTKPTKKTHPTGQMPSHSCKEEKIDETVGQSTQRIKIDSVAIN